MSVIFILGVFLLLVIGFAVVGFCTWPVSSPTPAPLILGHYIWSVSNGSEEPPFLTVSIPWPYTKRGKEVIITFVFQFPPITTQHPSNPILINLPTPASQLFGLVTLWAVPLPPHDTSVTVVQYGDAIAFKYEPSGLYLVGADLTQTYPVVFTITYLIP